MAPRSFSIHRPLLRVFLSISGESNNPLTRWQTDTSLAQSIASDTNSPGTLASFTARVIFVIRAASLWLRARATRTRWWLQIWISTKFARCATRGSSFGIADQILTERWWRTKSRSSLISDLELFGRLHAKRSTKYTKFHEERLVSLSVI